MVVKDLVMERSKFAFKYKDYIDNEYHIENGNRYKINNVYFSCIYRVNTLEDYIIFINSLLMDYSLIKDKHCDENTFLFRNNVHLFRGISSLNQLKPGIYRNKDYSKYEFEFIRKFEENASLKLGQFNNPLDLASAAQHYGIKTRLIDWTYSPLVATLFALFNDDSSFYGLVFRWYNPRSIFKGLPFKSNNHLTLSEQYYLTIKEFEDIRRKARSLNYKFNNYFNKDYSSINKEDLFNKTNASEREKKIFEEIEECAKRCIDDNNSFIKYINDKEQYESKLNQYMRALIHPYEKIFVETNYSNERIMLQRGLFEIYEKDMNQDISFSNLLIIDKSIRDDIIRYINNLGINYYTLMNDPENATKIILKTIEEELPYGKEYDVD